SIDSQRWFGLLTARRPRSWTFAIVFDVFLVPIEHVLGSSIVVTVAVAIACITLCRDILRFFNRQPIPFQEFRSVVKSFAEQRFLKVFDARAFFGQYHNVLMKILY